MSLVKTFVLDGSDVVFEEHKMGQEHMVIVKPGKLDPELGFYNGCNDFTVERAARRILENWRKWRANAHHE